MVLLVCLLLVSSCVTTRVRKAGLPLERETYIDTVYNEGDFRLAEKGKPATIYVDSADWPGVIRAAGDFAADINRVTGITPKITNSEKDLAKNTVIIGTIGKSPLINRLIKESKIDVKQVKGRWESTVTTILAKPVTGVDNALVIAGSDKRGTIYGLSLIHI